MSERSSGRVWVSDSQLSYDGRVSGHGFGREVVVAVGAVEEGLSPLAVARQVGVEDQARARGRGQVGRTAARRAAIFHIEAEDGRRDTRLASSGATGGGRECSTVQCSAVGLGKLGEMDNQSHSPQLRNQTFTFVRRTDSLACHTKTVTTSLPYH